LIQQYPSVLITTSIAFSKIVFSLLLHNFISFLLLLHNFISLLLYNFIVPPSVPLPPPHFRGGTGGYKEDTIGVQEGYRRVTGSGGGGTIKIVKEERNKIVEEEEEEGNRLKEISCLK